MKDAKNLNKSNWIVALAGALALAVPASSQESDQAAVPALTYADLVDLGDTSRMVIRAQIRRQIEVERERAPGLALGFARLYIEARTLALVAGSAPIGESLRYLVDVPLDERGKVPKLKKQEVLLFANPVAGRAGEVQLAGPGAQQMYSPALEARLRPILADLVAADAPPVVTGVRDALSVPGNLAGESETQIFLETRDDSPVSLTILHRPGRSPVWGVSWGEIIDQAARPPEPETIRWYRLACALPDRLPSGANLSRVPAERAQATRDYAFVLASLGPCVRNRVRQ